MPMARIPNKAQLPLFTPPESETAPAKVKGGGAKRGASGGADPEPIAPYVRKSRTSKEAAYAIDHALGKIQGQVLAFLQKKEAHGATDEEMQVSLALNPSTQRPRRIELLEKSLIRDSGTTRKTTSGRNAVVWIAL
jgi:hypothetical protein